MNERVRVSVAITGGIGAGKSTVLKILKECGYVVFSCDEISKDLSKEKSYLEKVKIAFPSAIDANGELNKKTLSDLVFQDDDALKKLNNLSHPIIMEKLQEKISSKSGLVFSEVPLLFEGHFENNFDFVIVVMRKLSDRIESVRARDQMHIDRVLARIKRQFDYDHFDFEKLSQDKFFIIWNNQGEEELKKSIENILRKICS